MNELTSHIPRNQQEMDRVKEGELVLITKWTESDKEPETFWSYFKGCKDNKYRFVTIINSFSEIIVNKSFCKYDKNLGVYIDNCESFRDNPNFSAKEIAGVWQEAVA